MYSMFWGQIILNYFLKKTSQAPSPALSVGKSEGKSSFIIGSIYAWG